MSKFITSTEEKLLRQLKGEAAAGLSDSSFASVLHKFKSGYYSNKAINVNTGKAVKLGNNKTYAYFTRESYKLAIRKDSMGNASYFVLNAFFNWYCDSLQAGRRIQEEPKKTSTGHFLHMDLKKKVDFENVVIVPLKTDKHCVDEINSENDSLDGFIVFDDDDDIKCKQIKKRQRVIDLTDD